MPLLCDPHLSVCRITPRHTNAKMCKRKHIGSPCTGRAAWTVEILTQNVRTQKYRYATWPKTTIVNFWSVQFCVGTRTPTPLNSSICELGRISWECLCYAIPICQICRITPRHTNAKMCKRNHIGSPCAGRAAWPVEILTQNVRTQKYRYATGKRTQKCAPTCGQASRKNVARMFDITLTAFASTLA